MSIRKGHDEKVLRCEEGSVSAVRNYWRGLILGFWGPAYALGLLSLDHER